MSLARALIEAEDPKRFLKKVAIRTDWVVAAKGTDSPVTLYWTRHSKFPWTDKLKNAHQMDIQEFAGFSEDEYDVNAELFSILTRQGVQALGLVNARRDGVEKWIYIQEADGINTLLNLIYPERARMQKAAENDLQLMNDEHGLGEAEDPKRVFRQVTGADQAEYNLRKFVTGARVFHTSLHGNDEQGYHIDVQLSDDRHRYAFGPFRREQIKLFRKEWLAFQGAMWGGTTFLEAEDPKMTLRRAKTGWQVKPIPKTNYHVALWFNGQEVHNMSIDCDDRDVDNSPGNAQALADYLNWLEAVLPWSDREGWVPNSWLSRADAQQLPERYMKETGKAAFKKETKTCARMVYPDEEYPVERPMAEAEDPKQVLRAASAQDNVEHNLREFLTGNEAIRCVVTHVGDMENYWLHIYPMYGPDEGFGPFRKDQVQLFRKEWLGFRNTRWEAPSYVFTEDLRLGEAENPKNVFRQVVSKAGGWSRPMRFIRADLDENPEVYAVEMTKSEKGTYVELLKIVIPGEVEIHPFGPFTDEEVQELMRYPTLQLVNWSYRDPIREAESPKRFLQQYGRDFSYGSDGTIIYVTPLNDATDQFLNTILLPGKRLSSDGTFVTQPEYLQQFLAQAGEAGLVGRRVKLEGELLQHFRPLYEIENPRAVFKDMTSMGPTPMYAGDDEVVKLSNWATNLPVKQVLVVRNEGGGYWLDVVRFDNDKVRAWGVFDRAGLEQVKRLPQFGQAEWLGEAEDPKAVFRKLPRRPKDLEWLVRAMEDSAEELKSAGYSERDPYVELFIQAKDYLLASSAAQGRDIWLDRVDATLPALFNGGWSIQAEDLKAARAALSRMWNIPEAKNVTSEAEALLEAEDPRVFLKTIAPHTIAVKGSVKITVRLRGQDDFITRSAVCVWEKSQVLGADGWKAGFKLELRGRKWAGLDEDYTQHILELVAYHIMEGPPEARGAMQFEEPDDPFPVEELEWVYVGNYEADQDTMTARFGGATDEPAPMRESESAKDFIKQHAIRDWVVKWSFGPPKPEKLAVGTTDGYRYSIVKQAAGPQEAVRLWRERTLPKYAPVTDREPIVHKVYIYTNGLGTLGEARRIVEAEDPKRFLRAQPHTDWVAKSFGGGMLWFECAAQPLLAFVLHWSDGPRYTVEYRRIDQSNFSEKESFALPVPDTNEAVAKAKQMAASFFWRKGWLGEAENPKNVLRQAAVARDKMIHCFKDFHFLRSVPRPNEPAMLQALHALQSKECEMAVAHVFTVLNLQAGYAFHQSVTRTDPTHFRTERMWNSVRGVPLSEPSFESLVAKIR